MSNEVSISIIDTLERTVVQGFKDKKRLLAYIFGTRHENLYTWVVSCAKSIRKGRGFEKSTGCCKMHKIYCKMCKNWYNSVSK